MNSASVKKVAYGDIISVRRYGGIYRHYAVYIGDGKVIHYAVSPEDPSVWEVREDPIEVFLKGKTAFDILEFSDPDSDPKLIRGTLNNMRGQKMISFLDAFVEKLHCKNYGLYTPEETVERAKSRLKEAEYSITFNNCEHFAVWCKTGRSESLQVNKVIETIKNI